MSSLPRFFNCWLHEDKNNKRSWNKKIIIMIILKMKLFFIVNPHKLWTFTLYLYILLYTLFLHGYNIYEFKDFEQKMFMILQLEYAWHVLWCLDLILVTLLFSLFFSSSFLFRCLLLNPWIQRHVSGCAIPSWLSKKEKE